ncbi:MAG: WecB/TagA/CpsF family glycosyltransferase [Candidatus Magasanikbacteria bacterium]|nr:WecB/TagA/CpsF family glycosyltransferase [Candidatus Magasanikbacteria bacterium]
MNFFGVRIDNVGLPEALNKARTFLISGQHKIFTPNPEILVKAQKDNYFRDVLNTGDLNLCDGFGLKIFSDATRIPGVDFMIELCRLASEQGSSVYFLGSGSNEVAEKTAEELLKQFPMLKIVGFDKGLMMDESNIQNFELRIDQINNQTVIGRINQSHPDILFVAFGMGKQEKWIHENLTKMPGVKIAMGVGGAFDYISGIVNRAPCWMRKIGIEWLYRLISQPKRIGRIFNATTKFTFFALKEKFYDHKN